MSIAKLRVGQEAYQLSGVAQSLDDYYIGSGEAAGTWIGAGAERLGLAWEVAAEDLRAVLAGMAPGSGGLSPNDDTIRPHPRRVPGFDLTFKVPKSVSVLYAVSDDPRVQGAIIEAGDVAVRDAVGWLEREAIRVRRGTANGAFLSDLAARNPEAAAAARIRSLPGRGVVAATFRHRTSRAGDPLLHWHTLVANLVEGPDGALVGVRAPGPLSGGAGRSVEGSGSRPCDDWRMIIVSGSLYVDAADRDAYLEGCREVIVAARAAKGCIDFHLSADPIEPDRINVYEQWESVEDVEAFRGEGPSSDQTAAIRDAAVFQHEVVRTTKL